MSADDPHSDAPSLAFAHIDALLAELPAWLEGRRWFAEKRRGISGVVLEGVHTDNVARDLLLLAVVRVAFPTGEDARYFLPVAWTESPGESEVIANVSIGPLAGAFIEASNAPWFGSWLVEKILWSAALADGAWSFQAHEPDSASLAAAIQHPATVMSAEQSNTSLRFGDAAMVKLVRRLQPGPSPDEELLRALRGVGFDSVPPYLGGGIWRAAAGESYPIALAQAFVPNVGDGWSWMLRRLRDLPTETFLVELGPGSPEALLGRRTGEMHLALSRISEPAFAPELVSGESIEADVGRVRESVDRTILLLREAGPEIPSPLRAALPSICAELTRASARAEGFRWEGETNRIRVHGDYHLGQTLRTPDEDWVIIDFEGEPARPVEERRRKSSALKDVAGMLRSFAYARGAAARDHAGEPAAPARWEAAARRAFIGGYRDAVRAAPTPLVPADEAAFMAALAAWELDKALYEVAYEVRNRPTWVFLPLQSLMPDDQP